ncbi:alkaline phosphatase family protein [Geminicoccaceae bacterium 1502E]|nr:alkaline phosphatase family protein [Geminicoccaceae bacterium 1502E]
MKRAVYVNCDGLCVDWISPELTPAIHGLGQAGLRATAHRSITPSVTRPSAASIATGCRPARHGLHGNRMALVEDGRLVVHDVGPPGFAAHMRRVLGRTLLVPTMAERLAGSGGFVAYSNVSPGAAAFLDPDGFGEVRHRAGSHGPRLTALPPLDVSHDLAGDEAMTRMFCERVVEGARPAAAILWLANPDLTLHGEPLGSPAHREALARTDACVRAVLEAVERRRAAGEDLLLLVGSDHGQETVHEGVDLRAWAARVGLAEALDQGRLAFATQGTAFFVYAMEPEGALAGRAVAALRAEPWVGEVVTGTGLGALGVPDGEGLVAVVDMARIPAANAHGVPGQRFAAFESAAFRGVGFGQHGGWGPDETRPFLVADHPAWAAGEITRTTSLVDVAPTILSFLGEPEGGMDGIPLAPAA